MGSKRFDVVRVQFNGVTITAASAALLAGVVVALKDDLAPFGVFALAACDVVLMALVYVPRPSGALRFLGLFGSVRVGNLGATIRAHLADHTSLAVFGHRLTADRTRHGYRHALSAHLVGFTEVMRSLSAYLASYTDTACICFQSSSTRYAGGIFDGLTVDVQCRHWFTTLAARRKSGTIARFAKSIFPAVCFALDTSVLCHVAIIPQLPDLEKLV